MSTSPTLTLSTVTLSAPDPYALAGFYERLLGWPIKQDETDDNGDAQWVVLRNPAGGVSLACQSETDYIEPVWPGERGDQRMMMHLEIQVDDLAASLAHAISCGARLADFQPQDDVRVCLDPAGHPFCLWV